MKLLHDRSLRCKLTVIVMTTTCVTLVASLVGLAVFDQISFREQLCRQMLTRSTILANSSTAALSFGDRELGREILSALRAEPSLGAAILYDEDGQVFAKYTRNGWRVPAPEGRLDREVVFGKNYLQVAAPIVVGRRTIGFALLQSDLRRIDGWCLV